MRNDQKAHLHDDHIDIDMNARRATCRAEGALVGRGEPILNPVTGAEHRVGIVLPNGFEYGQNEVAAGGGGERWEGGVGLEGTSMGVDVRDGSRGGRR